jgi:hypothetical protein
VDITTLIGIVSLLAGIGLVVFILYRSLTAGLPAPVYPPTLTEVQTAADVAQEVNAAIAEVERMLRLKRRNGDEETRV